MRVPTLSTELTAKMTATNPTHFLGKQLLLAILRPGWMNPWLFMKFSFSPVKLFSIHILRSLWLWKNWKVQKWERPRESAWKNRRNWSSGCPELANLQLGEGSGAPGLQELVFLKPFSIQAQIKSFFFLIARFWSNLVILAEQTRKQNCRHHYLYWNNLSEICLDQKSAWHE